MLMVLGEDIWIVWLTKYTKRMFISIVWIQQLMILFQQFHCLTLWKNNTSASNMLILVRMNWLYAFRHYCNWSKISSKKRVLGKHENSIRDLGSYYSVFYTDVLHNNTAIILVCKILQIESSWTHCVQIVTFNTYAN